MIVDAVLSFFVGLVSVVLGWLPSPSPPDIAGAVSALGPVWTWFGWANDYLPVTEAVGLLGVLLSAWAAMWLFRAGVWIATKAHILGGSSD